MNRPKIGYKEGINQEYVADGIVNAEKKTYEG